MSEQSRRNDAFAAQRHKEDQELRRLANLGARFEEVSSAVEIALSRHKSCRGSLEHVLGVLSPTYTFHCDTCKTVIEVSNLEAAAAPRKGV